MQSASYQQQHYAILYDADRLPRPLLSWFTPEFWSTAELMGGGRGAAWRIDSDWGEAALKRYRRGGWAAPLLGDRYWFRHWHVSRSWSEWRLLAHLAAHNFPAPTPWAALVERSGRWSRCAMLSGWIAGSRPLLDVDAAILQSDQLWRELGQLVARLAALGVQHVDLNLGNVLRRDDGVLFLIDFDRARWRSRATAPVTPQYQRLLRSLRKLQHMGKVDAALDPRQVAVWLEQGG
ncbi:MAG: 3-deoxy-D-manno-octulosonic acid kinase [Wenzhouxiangellaceae bacterium]